MRPSKQAASDDDLTEGANEIEFSLRPNFSAAQNGLPLLSASPDRLDRRENPARASIEQWQNRLTESRRYELSYELNLLQLTVSF